MCPVPKSAPESPDKEDPPLPVANVDVSNVLNSTAAPANIIHNNIIKPSSEELLNIENDTQISNLSTVTTQTSIENDKYCNGAQINSSLFPHSCESHSAKQISCLSVDNCSKLLYLEETKVHHLSSISMDWTLLIDRQAANCRNTSDEVFPSIYLGDRGAAKNAFYLKKIGVTHVLNTAEGKKTGLVDTNEDFYYPYGIKYMGIKLFDVAQTNISKHFLDVADYIDEALDEGGKVLVNCLKGMSRSSTVVLAYLMLRKNMTAMDALTVVRRHREVCPNDGFLQQLAELDNKLRRERGQLITRTGTATAVK